MIRAGVICEFNPFHNGHKFLLEKIKDNFADEIVCVMSGSFVQRGDIAITDKYRRAEAALRNGADMVAELPTVYAVSSARIFARNGVRAAYELGCDKLCFGAESSAYELSKISLALSGDAVRAKIKNNISEGLSYPSALSKAIAEALGESYAAMMEKPNNILALEYIDACRVYGVEPIAIERKDAVHDGEESSDHIASAGKIRSLMENNEPYSQFTPMELDRIANIGTLESAIVYSLKTKKPEEIALLADISEGLENRIYEAAQKYNSAEEILSAVKTKRYPLSKLRRILIYSLLGISSKLQNKPLSYIRALGIKSGNDHMLKTRSLPLIARVKADYEKLDNSAKEIFSIDLKAAQAMSISLNDNSGNEFSKPFIKV